MILRAAMGEEQDTVTGPDIEADDCIIRPFRARDLRARLRIGRRVRHLHDQLADGRTATAGHAIHDPLTGLLNRSPLDGSLHRELARTRREGSSFAVAMADLDHFKEVNDAYGHATGDAVLRGAAERLRSSVRSYDSLFRYGGGYFLLVAPGCDEAAALAFGERMRGGIEMEPVSTPRGPVPITVSVGVAATCGAGVALPSALVQRADAAMRRAKSNGRNRVELAREPEAQPGQVQLTAQ